MTNAKDNRIPAIIQLPLNADAVEKATTGFITGAASIKAMAVGTGSPFFISLPVIGTIPHSQIGKNTPTKQAAIMPANLFFGKRRLIKSSETKLLISAETNTPIRIKGNASITIPRKIIRKFSILEKNILNKS